jgi:hypothetical protein
MHWYRVPFSLSYKSGFWVLQLALLLATILFLSWYFSANARGAFTPPTFQATLKLMLLWAAITKLPVLLLQFILIRRTFWLGSGPLVRALLFYFADLICSILAIVLLWQLWVATLFTDAGFPAALVIFPQNAISAIVMALVAPSLAAPEDGVVRHDVDDPVVGRIIPLAIGLTALLLSFLLATTIAGNAFDLFGQLLAFLPVALLFARVYFDPALVAARRKPQRAILLLFLNLLVGWTIIGWLLCLLWVRLSQSTLPVIRKKLNWKRVGALLITGTGMMISGVGISTLGETLATAQVEGEVAYTGQIVVLLLCILWLSGGLRLLVKSGD